MSQKDAKGNYIHYSQVCNITTWISFPRPFHLAVCTYCTSWVTVWDTDICWYNWHLQCVWHWHCEVILHQVPITFKPVNLDRHAENRKMNHTSILHCHMSCVLWRTTVPFFYSRFGFYFLHKVSSQAIFLFVKRPNGSILLMLHYLIAWDLYLNVKS